MIAAAQLFRPLGAELIALLRSLAPGDWAARTSAPEWQVRDVVAHLLDVDGRRLSVARDAHVLPPPRHALDGYDPLLAWLDALNAEWVAAARRMSPRVLTDLLELTTTQVAALMEAADPHADAVFPVAWAGQTTSPMWLDIGREYTERWHHQDQIREAVGAPPLDAPQWLRPVIEISLIALPHTYRAVEAPRGTRLALAIDGAAGGDWLLERAGDWRITAGPVSDAVCRFEMRDLAFARLLLHRLPLAAARAAARITGDERLADPLLRARAVMVRT